MFGVTFLGHQGWLFASRETHILVDPLLVEPFGHRGLIGRFHPPRELDPAGFPPIDAVLISHEHEDHFNVPSLNRLDRRIPIYLSERSSDSARRFLGEMGFTVGTIAVDRTIEIGDLRFTALPADHLGGQNGDEWDVLPYLVCDRAGHGSFYSCVDLMPQPALLDRLEQLVARPGLWCLANNVTDWGLAHAGGHAEPASDTVWVAELMLRELRELTSRWRAPAGCVLCGGGWTLGGDRAALDQRIWCADSERIARAMRALAPELPIAAPTPGETFVMERGAVVDVIRQRPYLAAAPRASWPARGHRSEPVLLGEYQPATGRLEIDDDDLDELERELDGFAAFLYARGDFRALYSLTGEAIAGRRPTFALVLLCDAERNGHVYEYRPQRAAFVRAESDDPVADYLGGLECWASDLLALFRGWFSPYAITMGRLRTWQSDGGAPRPQLTGDLTLYCHPLRRPPVTLRMYRRLLALEPEAVPRVPAAGAAGAAARAAS